MSLSLSNAFLITLVVFVLLPSGTAAFGAGDIPDISYLNDKAFRHGDIENVLLQVAKGATAAAGGRGLLGFAKQMIEQASSGGNFTKADVKKIYFGNWLRDYSQAMDIGGLQKLTADTLVLVVAVLGFMTFGFATEEFQVTAERLGVYLPVCHLDNPKGYAEKEGDPRKFHPQLRPPVDPQELEIDDRTGMKNYLATENRGWDTSTAFIRRTFRKCIEYGRRAGGREGAELWEAYRLLGTGLHSLEDFSAHSNWCEIALVKMGYDVFPHVGEGTYIETPAGRAPPLVTGTFGGADFLHSLLGEATDHLSQASVTALSQKMDTASKSDAPEIISTLKSLLSKFGGEDKLAQGEQLQSQSQAYNFDPDNIAPSEVQAQLWTLLNWRDDVYRDVLKKIEMIPGLSDLIEQLTDALNAYVYTVLAPWLTPILKQTTDILGDGAKAVIDSEDQFEVFNNPNASDPSHSLLSKDHFGLILNEPAGKVAQVVVLHTAQMIVQAWNDNSNPDQVIDEILQALHHPHFATGRSRIQHEMMEVMEKWIGGLGPDVARDTLKCLTKESVRNGKNKRLGEDQNITEPGYGGGYGYQSAGDGRESAKAYDQTDHRWSSNRDEHQSSIYTNDSGRNRYRQDQSSSQLSYGDAQYAGSRNDNDERQRQRQENEYTDGYGRSGNEYGRADNYGKESSRYNEHGAAKRHDDDYRQADSLRAEESYRPMYSSSGDGDQNRRGRHEHDNQENEYRDGYGRSGNEYGRAENYEEEHSRYNEHGSTRRHHDDHSKADSLTYSSSGDADEDGHGQRHGHGRHEHDKPGREDRQASERRGYTHYDTSNQRDDIERNETDYGREQYVERNESSGHGRAEYGRTDESGYNPSYGQEEAFGVDRLNIQDDGYSRRSRNEYEDSGY